MHGTGVVGNNFAFPAFYLWMNSPIGRKSEMLQKDWKQDIVLKSNILKKNVCVISVSFCRVMTLTALAHAQMILLYLSNFSKKASTCFHAFLLICNFLSPRNHVWLSEWGIKITCCSNNDIITHFASSSNR